jgi:hypothetical protein
MKKLKWFWIINYILTIYALLILIKNYVNVYDFELYERIFKIGTQDILSINSDIDFIMEYAIEWLQIPIVLTVLIWKKSERSRIHWLYWFFLILLAFFKIILYFIAVGAWMLHQP